MDDRVSATAAATVAVTAIVTAFRRIEQALETLRRIEACRPAPDEILVHIDANQEACAEAIRSAFPHLRVLRSTYPVGPGGGRNKLVAEARNELISSFDDDSYPLDADYFWRARASMQAFPKATMIGASIFHRGETVTADQMVVSRTASFMSGGVVFRRSDFLAAGGFVPLVVAYGMEEEDLALRFIERGLVLLTSPWLRIYHDSDRSHHTSAAVTAGTISNLALLAYLRYPTRCWSYGVLQVANRVLWSIRMGRFAGIARGLASIPRHLWRHRHLRAPVSMQAMRSRREARAAAGSLRTARFAAGRLLRASMRHRYSHVSTTRWILCQIGAREHYALPRVLNARGMLKELITDVWVPPGSPFVHLPGQIGMRLRGRYEPELAAARVAHFTGTMVRAEIGGALRRGRGRWDLVLRRNELFQDMALRHLVSSGALRRTETGQLVVFAYAYAARKILAAAREVGAMTVLGQIDGGLGDHRHMEPIWRRHSGLSAPPECPPARYWEGWQEECCLADRIVANSPWSRDLLVGVGIPAQKIVVVPVIYEPLTNGGQAERDFPENFTKDRPLRVLFLGSLVVRKGAVEALQAARELHGKSVEFTFVGADSEGLGAMAHKLLNVRWQPAVPRSEVGGWHNWADVFLFPTHSDGFGITQLEALGAGLPVIASRNCAAIVEHGRTGLLLEEVSAEAIVRAVCFCLDHAGKLPGMSREAQASAAAFARSSTTTFLDAIEALAAPER